jgi:hypothetical protein
MEGIEEAFLKASEQLRQLKEAKDEKEEKDEKENEGEEDREDKRLIKVYEPHFALIVDNKIHSVCESYDDCEDLIFEMIIDNIYKNGLNNPHVVKQKDKYILYNSTLLFLITHDRMISTYRIKRIPKIIVHH